MPLSEIVELPLHIERADGFAVFKIDNPFARRIARDVARAADGVVEHEISRQLALFEQRKHARGRADFQRVGERAHVGIADEQMEPAIFAIIGQRLVARVDDGAIELHPLINVVDDVIGALAQLKRDRRFRLRRLEIERQRIGLPYSAGAGENLSRREKREQRAEHRRRELRLAFHQIIFVATKRRAGVMIDVVLNKRDAIVRFQRGERFAQQRVAGHFVSDEIVQMQTFGRRVFDVAHVEIKPAAVEKKTAVAGRFFVIAIVKIDRAGARLVEKDNF